MPFVFVLRQCQALAARGHAVEVAYVVPAAPPISAKWRAYRSIPTSYIYEGVPVIVMRALVPPKMLNLQAVRRQVRPQLQAIIARLQPDIVHVHCLVPPGFFTVGLAKPVLLTAHGSDVYLYPRQRADLLAAAVTALETPRVVVAVSEFIKREVQQLKARDVRVIYNGADPRIFVPADRAAARAVLGLHSERPVVAYAGTIARFKGLFELVQAAQRLAALQPQVVLAGSGPDTAELRSAFRTSRVEATFLGALPQGQVAKMFAAADVVTLPSHAEGLPTVICEAMLSGRAVVTTPVGGLPEIVRDGETGLLTPVGDDAALAGALRRVLTDSSLRTQMEANALEFASRHLTWSANARAYEAVYSELLSAG